MRPRKNDLKRFFNSPVVKTKSPHFIFVIVEINARQGGPLNTPRRNIVLLFAYVAIDSGLEFVYL